MTKEDFLKVHLCKTCVHALSGGMWDFCEKDTDKCVYMQDNKHCYTQQEKLMWYPCNIVKKCNKYKEKSKCV